MGSLNYHSKLEELAVFHGKNIFFFTRICWVWRELVLFKVQGNLQLPFCGHFSGSRNKLPLMRQESLKQFCGAAAAAFSLGDVCISCEVYPSPHSEAA